MTQEERREESDQLPEEGPPEQIPDDADGSTREGAEKTPGAAGDEPERQTGDESDE